MSAKRLRVGILGLFTRGWSAGQTYTRMMLQSLAARAAGRMEIVLLTRPEGEGMAAGLPVEVHLVEGEDRTRVEDWALRVSPRTAPIAALAGKVASRALGVEHEPAAYFEAERLGLDAILPAMSLPRPLRCGVAGWIPDFQHVCLPQYFSDAERRRRDLVFHGLSRRAGRVILSSEWARTHFEAFSPEHAKKAAVLPFPSTFAFDRPRGEAGAAARELGLPAKFALVINQMWQHKNHELAVAGVAEARARGVEVPLVMVGTPADHRDPENETVSRVLQRALKERVHDLVMPLGKVPFATLLDLLRSAAVLVQPSRFEGWSTSVEDAKALGRPLLCSDLPVHREQAPDAGFFGVDDAAALGALLAERFRDLPAGPDLAAEAAALDRERDFAGVYGDRLIAVIESIAR